MKKILLSLAIVLSLVANVEASKCTRSSSGTDCTITLSSPNTMESANTKDMILYMPPTTFNKTKKQ